MILTIIFAVIVAVGLLCCLRVGSMADEHDKILRDSENEKY